MRSLSENERIAVVGAFALLLGAVLQPLITRYRTDPNLSLLDVRFADTTGEDRERARLDVKVRNDGERAAVLTSAIVHVDRVWRLRALEVQDAALAPTGAYRVNLSTSAATPYTATIALSQAVPPGDVDRFTIDLDTDHEEDGLERPVFLLRVTMQYGGRSLTTPPLLAAIISTPGDNFEAEFLPEKSKMPAEIRALYPFSRRTVAANAKAAAEIQNTQALMNPLCRRWISVLLRAALPSPTAAPSTRPSLSTTAPSVVPSAAPSPAPAAAPRPLPRAPG